MNPWIAIPFTIGILAATAGVSMTVGVDVTGIMILLTSLWAAVDSSRLHLKRYKSGIAYGPVVLFLGCALLWIVGFPWYLVMRYRINTGVAVLKEGVTDDAA